MRNVITAVVLSLIFCPVGFSQNQAEVDSLKQLILHAKKDSNHIKLLLDLAGKYRRRIPDTALHYYQQALDISMELDRKEDLGTAYQRIGSVLINLGDYDQAMEKYMNSLDVFEEIDDKNGIAKAYNDMGIIYKNQGAYDKAVENYLLSLRIKEEMGDRRGMARTYNNIAVVYAMQDSDDQAIDYFLKSLEIKEELGEKPEMASSYNNIAIIYSRQSAFDEALEYLHKALSINEEMGDKLGASLSLANIGNVLSNQKEYDRAIDTYHESLSLKEEIGDKNGMAILYKNIADLNIELADSVATSQTQRIDYLNNAVANGRKSLDLAREMQAIPHEAEAAASLQEAYAMLGMYKEAYEFGQIYTLARDSLLSEEKTRAIQDMTAKYESEKKEQQIQLQESQLIAKDATIKQQKAYRNALAAGFMAVIIVIAIIVLAFIQKKKDNRKIREQNEKILEANEELKVLNEAISKQNNEIIDSINYAQRIQLAMLPPEKYFTELLNEVMVYYKPRDIVSGDFYWIKQVNRFIIVAAADCTGHGVPGAFMSVLGISYLNEIVQRREVTRANQVLNELRTEVKHSLRQHGQRDESKDAIDMALCVIDTKNNMMQYAGAYNPLYLIRDVKGKPELIEYKADRMPIGYHQGKDIAFTNHDIKLEIGDTLYMFSDGFVDQKGGEENKKYMTKNFKRLLLEIHAQPMCDQEGILDQTLKDWIGGDSQMDDILVVGVRV